MNSKMDSEPMELDRSLLDLPDLVLYHICSSITCPFDLLRFGNTCSRLRKISSASSIWWSMSFRWLKGLFILMEEGSTEENSREWFLDLLHQYYLKPTGTRSELVFSDVETWKRVNSPKLRFLFHLIRIAYTKDKDDSPAVLFEQWLYDVGLYRRSGNGIDYTRPDFEFTPDSIQQLSSLGQAAERDLCRRKQPYKDLKYYVKRVGVSQTTWMSDLFPSGLHGSICPLLMCPFQNTDFPEVTGVQGLAMCAGVVFERRLDSHFIASSYSLSKVWEIIKVICTVFIAEFLVEASTLEAEIGNVSLKSVVMYLVEANSYGFPHLQKYMESLKLSFDVQDVLLDLYNLLKRHEGIDFIVDEIRFRLREAMNEEIQKILFPPAASNNSVTRINLTDSDCIGGDNSKQEMSAAAFVSDHGALVTWHLIGRMRF